MFLSSVSAYVIRACKILHEVSSAGNEVWGVELLWVLSLNSSPYIKGHSSCSQLLLVKNTRHWAFLGLPEWWVVHR